jgi:hypothetical protein
VEQGAQVGARRPWPSRYLRLSAVHHNSSQPIWQMKGVMRGTNEHCGALELLLTGR